MAGPLRLAAPIYIATAALAAALLFAAQPMIAKRLLPTLGGAPAVWIVCAAFFQAALLGGYAYAHALGRARSPRRQAAMHAGVLLLAALACLPLEVRPTAASSGAATEWIWLVGELAATIGAPAVALAATTPLLSAWFAGATRVSPCDPYVLYAGSNLGSLLGLLAYPIVVEPYLDLDAQAAAWTAGYLVLGAAVTLIAATAAVEQATAAASTATAASATSATDAPPGAGALAAPAPDLAQRLRWLFLAFVPTSLYLGFTTWVTTDIAAVPLLWVAPLAIYLGAFVAAFSRRPPPRAPLLRVLPVALFGTAALTFLLPGRGGAWLFAAHAVQIVLGCLVAAGELAAARPPAPRLTEYYLFIAAGGVLGGLWNAIAAPSLFDGAVEYPLALVLLCLCRPDHAGDDRRPRPLDVALPLVVLVALLEAARRARAAAPLDEAHPWLFAFALLGALPFVLAPARRGRLAAGFAAFSLAAALFSGGYRQTLFADRSFFGVHRVVRDGDFNVLMHGTTRHGMQHRSPERRHEALGYYAEGSPAADVLAHARASWPEIAVVGLGAGALAAHAAPGQRWTFFELDPMVAAIARDPSLFTYLHDAAADLRVVIGDARLSLAAAEPVFQLIVLDAFGSDAIPIHLITREAVAQYLRRLAPGGVLLFNVTNRYVRIAPVLAAAARDLGLSAWRADDEAASAATARLGRIPSEWVLLSRDARPRWLPARWRALAPGATPAFTDGFSSLFRVLRR